MSEKNVRNNVKRHVIRYVRRNVTRYVRRYVRRYARRYVRKGCPKICQKICKKRMSERMSKQTVRRDARRYVRKGCQRICPKKCHKERLYWTGSIEFQVPRPLKPRYISLAKHFYIFQILVPRRLGVWRRPGVWRRLGVWRRPGVWNCFEPSIPRASLNQFGQIDHSGHCWNPNQEKGRGGEDNSDEILRPKDSRFHQNYPLLLVLARF